MNPLILIFIVFVHFTFAADSSNPLGESDRSLDMNGDGHVGLRDLKRFMRSQNITMRLNEKALRVEEAFSSCGNNTETSTLRALKQCTVNKITSWIPPSSSATAPPAPVAVHSKIVDHYLRTHLDVDYSFCSKITHFQLCSTVPFCRWRSQDMTCLSRRCNADWSQKKCVGVAVVTLGISIAWKGKCCSRD